jgi:Fe-S oxidoreductase
MTNTYDPNLAEYLDEASVRREMARAVQVCAECRQCHDRCPVFRDTFRVLDMLGNEADRMTPHVQDQLADACYDCGLCLLECPHSPALESPGVDVPALMLRHRAMARAAGLRPLRRRLAGAISGRRELLRRTIRRLPGGVRERIVPAGFAEWFAQRPRVRSIMGQGRVAVFPTCGIEYGDPGVGVDAVKVLEHNGVECSVVCPTRCCGAELLAEGDVGRFTQVAIRNIREFKKAVDDGREIVVLSARCLEVVQKHYLDFVGGPDARHVAQHAQGIAGYLMALHEGEEASLDLEFRGDRPGEVAHGPSCAARSSGEAHFAEALMRLTGCSVSRFDQCCGGGECREILAGAPSAGHPVQLLARAYGLARER